MSKLTVTNIRLPKEELVEFRQIALEEGKSFSEYIREIVGQYVHQKKVVGKAHVHKIKVGRRREEEPIWRLKPFNSGIKDGAREHDKYIYR